MKPKQKKSGALSSFEEEQLRAMNKDRKQDPFIDTTDSVDAAGSVEKMVADPLVWIRQYTKTKDSHWREHDADSPNSPFPDKPYFHPLLQGLKDEPVIFIGW